MRIDAVPLVLQKDAQRFVDHECPHMHFIDSY